MKKSKIYHGGLNKREKEREREKVTKNNNKVICTSHVWSLIAYNNNHHDSCLKYVNYTFC